jgi:hypothetical protein
LDEGVRFPLCHPDALQGLFGAAGLRQVESRAIDVPARFRDFSDYWQLFVGGQGPAPAYAMSLNEDDHVRLRLMPCSPDSARIAGSSRALLRSGRSLISQRKARACVHARC